MIKQDCIERIKNIPLVDIAKGMGIATKKRGANYVCCCPFHNEKTPSFSINPTKNIGKCFGGCGTGVANAIQFVMKYKKMDFYEAALEAAKIGGIEVEYEQSWSEEKKAAYEQAKRYKEAIYKALTTATDAYQKALANKEQPYLKERKFTADTIKQFQIGFADKDGSIWGCKELKIYSEHILKAASLMSDKGKPFFWNRIVFPIYFRGRVAGFAGRSIAIKPKVKYLNSKNDEQYGTFTKGKVLYNFDEAMKHLHPKLGVVVMEGYTDVWAMWQSEIRYAVATCGVALTADHIDDIKRHTNRITLFRDNDAAGAKATLREIEMLLPYGMEIQVLTLPKEEERKKIDADDYRMEKGELELRNFTEHAAVDWYEYVKSQLSAADTKEPDQVKQLLQLVSLIPDDFEFEYRRNNLIEDYKAYKQLIRNNAARKRVEQQTNGKTAIKRTVKNGRLKNGNGQDPINIQNVDHYQFDTVEEYYKSQQHLIKDRDFKFRNGFYTQEKSGEKIHFELLREEYENKRIKHREFWFEKEITKGPNAGETITRINRVAYLDFLQENGYFNVEINEGEYQIMKIAGNIVSPIKDADVEISNFVKNFLRKIKKNNAAWGAFLSNPSLTKDATFKKLDVRQVQITSNDFDKVTLYFKNSIVEVSPDDIKVLSIKELHKSNRLIWESQIIQRNFEYIEDVTESDFFKFFILALTKEQTLSKFFKNGLLTCYEENIDDVEQNEDMVSEHLKLLFGAMSAQGYIARRVKDPEEAVMVSFADAQMANRFDRNGRNGKSIIAGKHFRESGLLKVHYIPNSKWNVNDPRKFEGIEADTQLVNFQDIDANPKNFALDMVFEALTDDWVIERRYIGSLYLPFATSPNLTIDSNGIIKGKGAGGSYEDRIYRLPVSNYFNHANKPTRITEKNRRFFSKEWSDWQWNCYFSFIIQCIQLNLFIKKSRRYKEKSLPPINIASLRLREMQERGFPLWLMPFLDALPVNEQFIKKEKLEALLNDPHYREDINEWTIREKNSVKITPYKFKTWYAMYAEYKGYKFKTNKTDGKEYWAAYTTEYLANLRKSEKKDSKK